MQVWSLFDYRPATYHASLILIWVPSSDPPCKFDPYLITIQWPINKVRSLFDHHPVTHHESLISPVCLPAEETWLLSTSLFVCFVFVCFCSFACFCLFLFVFVVANMTVGKLSFYCLSFHRDITIGNYLLLCISFGGDYWELISLFFFSFGGDSTVGNQQVQCLSLDKEMILGTEPPLCFSVDRGNNC